MIRRRFWNSVVVLSWISVAAVVTGCERSHWEEGSRSTPVTGPADVFGRLIVGAVLAATEDGDGSEQVQMGKLSCRDIGYKKLKRRGETFDLKGFSVKSPSEGHWCLQRSDEKRLAFATHPWAKMPTSKASPTDKELLNTFVLAAVRIRARTEQLEEAGNLVSFAKDWVKSGSHIELSNGEIIAEFQLPSRFTLVEYSLTERALSGLQCVSYEYTAEERQNPNFPQEVFTLHAAGVLCPDYFASDRLIALNFSERYAQGSQINTVLFTHWRDNVAEPFFNSLAPRQDHGS